MGRLIEYVFVIGNISSSSTQKKIVLIITAPCIKNNTAGIDDEMKQFVVSMPTTMNVYCEKEEGNQTEEEKDDGINFSFSSAKQCWCVTISCRERPFS